MADKSVFDDMLASVGAPPHTGKGNLIDSFPLDGFTQLDVPIAGPAPAEFSPAAPVTPATPAHDAPAPQQPPAPAAPQYTEAAPPLYTPPVQPQSPGPAQPPVSHPAPAQYSVPAQPPYTPPLPQPAPAQYSAPVQPPYPPSPAPPQPYALLPDELDEEEEEPLPPAAFAAQAVRPGPGAGALELVKTSYEQAVSLEYYQMQQAGRLQQITAILLAAAGTTLSLCFSRSVPGYFEFYISACACPILLALVLALTFAVVRPPQDGADRLPASEDLSARELYDAYVSLEEEISLANRRRAAALRRNAVLLWLCAAVCIGFIITGVGIGA